ncbi:hypothetical protein BDM02DRAFT_3107165 [Thelephora ganbajun]|uniref:Uncharacterized protein n=1 Tax=Thelephora ganbajun TaxID=370292 RepID=A0ACB6ZWX7_THEGA|nr:hypothetical protein BDM02DRAFT_3107165 [Thelephora ganbajun]
MNPPGHNPTNNHADPRLSGYPQPQPVQSNTTHQQQHQQQQTHQDYDRQSHQLQYISTPPLAAPGVFQNPNPSPFTTTPRTSVQTTSPPPVRYQCDKCSTTFSRLHDRNRHYESTHSENPPTHKCERCRKKFSRADAKKRHQDDGKCMSNS